MTAAYDFATGRVRLPEVKGVSHSALWHVGYEMAVATNQTTRQSWLSVKTLTKRTGLSERTVQRARAALVAAEIFVPVESDEKSQVYLANWKISARRHHKDPMFDPKPMDGLSRSTVTMLCTLHQHSKKSVKTLARLCRISEVSVRVWRRKYMAPPSSRGARKYVAPEQSAPSPVGSEGPSGLTPRGRSGPASRAQRISARWQRLREREARLGMYGIEFASDQKHAPETRSLAALRMREKGERAQRASNRRSKPHDQWTVKDVWDEFRIRYDLKYPMHSPDELCSNSDNGKGYRMVLGMLARAKGEGVTMVQMVAAIDQFYARDLDRRYSKFPAWRKFLWCVENTRPQEEHEYVRQQQTAAPDSKDSAGVGMSTSTSTDQFQDQLASLKIDLEEARLDEELYAYYNNGTTVTMLESQIARIELRIKEAS